jgi:hypothetical protein
MAEFLLEAEMLTILESESKKSSNKWSTGVVAFLNEYYWRNLFFDLKEKSNIEAGGIWHFSVQKKKILSG